MSKAALCVVKHLGKNSPINAYRVEMAGDVDELVAGGMDKDAAWLQVIDEKLTNLRGEKARIEQVVADAYANTAAGKRAPKPDPAQAPVVAAQPETTDAQRQQAADHAKDLGGRVVWQRGDLALVEGYSMLSGDSVYIAAKGSQRTRVDIKSFTGAGYTEAEKAELMKARADAVRAADELLARNPDGPFADDPLVFASDIPEAVRGVVRGWINLLGLDSARIVVTTPASGAAMADGLAGKFRRIGKANLSGDNTNGTMQPLGGDDFHIAVRPGVSTLKALEVMAHELGHIVERRAFAQASAGTQQAIRDAHAAWLKENGSGRALDMAQAMRAYRSGQTTGFSEDAKALEAGAYWRSFGEWFADQVSRWATTEARPVGVVEQFFKRLADRLRVFFTGERAKFKPDTTVAQWLDSLAKDVPPAGEVAAVEPVAESAPTAPINTEDAGAELTYNRRNRIKSGIKWDDIASKNDALKVKEAVKQNVYPRPDYQALVDGGMQPLVAHLVKQAYDAIAAKPNTRGAPTDADLQTYIAGVNRVMAGVLAWANDPVSLSKWATREARSAGAMLGKSVNLSELAPGAGKSMLESVYPEGWKGNQAEVIVLGGNKLLGSLQPSYDEAKRAGKAVDAGWPASQEAWEKRGIKIIHAEKIDVSYYEGKRSRTEQPYVSISYKVGQTRLMDQLIDGAESQNDPKVQAAVAAELEANQGMFIVMDKARRIVGKQETEEAAKDVARELTKREGKDGGPDDSGIDVAMARREGPPRRLDGENVSSDQLKDAFGFKGVNFGNWMKGDTPALRAERQAHLNHAYDSFADLADLFGVPAKAMSLNGMLGLAIGAQGNGKYAAHFVPGVNEINLTRASGAGSLAHEWGHALDHYFAEQAGFAKRDEPFLTEHTTSVVRKVVVENGRERMVVDTDAQRIRPEIVERFKAIVQAMNRKPETVEQFNARQERSKEIAKSNVSSWLKSIRRDYVAKGVDEAAIDALAARILALDVGDGKIMVSPTLAVHPVVDELRSLYRKKAGRVPPIDQIKGLQSNLDYYAYAMSEKPGAVDHVPQQVSTDYANAAAAMDKDKGGRRYWSTNLEKFARAFDAFVSDELEAKAAKNTYLSHAGRTGETVPMGDERKTINTAIKALVGEIQTRTDDAGNVALFSRAPGVAKDVANAWRILSENDEVFTYAKSDSTDFAEIANGTDAIFAEPEPGRVGADVERAWRIYPAPGGQPDKSKRGHVIHYKDGKVELNVENFTEGSAGSAAYAAVGNYAFNNGLQFAPDRFGMTQAAIERRLESLISLALKFGSTDFIRLSPAQLKAFKMKWRDGDTAFNTEQMLMASYNALAATFPEIKGYTYDLETGARKSDVGAVGRDEPGTEGIVARARAAGARAGKRTVARAIFTNTFASEPAGKARRELLGRLSDGNASLLGDNALAKSLYSRRSEANAEELRAYAGAESGVAGDVPLAAGGQATPQSQIRRAGATDGLAASRPGQAGVQRAGVPIADAEAVADAIRSAYPTGPQIVVLDDVRKAPEALLDQIRAVQAANTVEGAYYKGKIYLFPQNVADIQRLMFVGAHHEIRHAGLDALFGKRKGALLLSIAMSNPKVAAAARQKMAEGLADSMVAATEEALADMPLADMAKLNGWNKIVAAVRQWLRGLADRLRRNHPKLAALIQPDQWTDNDVAALIQRAEDISRGGTVPARAAGAVFSRADDKPLSEAKFYSRYLMHKDIRGKRAGNAAQTAKAIMRDGFQSQGPGAVNVMPAYRGGEPRFASDVSYAPRAGDTVYLVPREAVKGDKVVAGWKPKPFEVLTITEDYQALFPLYLEAFAAEQAKSAAFSRDKTLPASTDTRRYQNLKWEQSSDDMQTAELGNGWVATIMQDEDGSAELSILDPRGVDFGEPMTYAHIGEARLAAPGILARRILEDGTQPGDSMAHLIDGAPDDGARFSRADQTQTPDTRPQAVRAVQTMPRSPLTGRPVFDLMDAAGNRIETQHHAKTADEALENYRERPARQAAARAAAPVPTYAMPEKAAKAEGSNWRRVRGQEFTSLDEDDGYLYHVTSAPAAAGVREQGLVPNAGGMFGGFYANYSAGKVFLTERSGVSYWQEKVGQQLEQAMDNPPAVTVLRIPKDKIKAKLVPDAVGSGDAGAPAFYSNEAVFSRSAGTAKTTAQDLLNSNGGVFGRAGETRQDRVRAVVDGSRPFWLGALTRDQIADMYGDELPPVRDYDNLTRAMENERQSAAQKADELYEEWSKIDAEANDRLARVMLDATVAQVHPDRETLPATATEEQKQAHGRLRVQFKLLPKDAQVMYGKVRDFHANTLKDLRAALEGRIERLIENGSERAVALADIRARFDKYMQGGPYFPLHRFGDFLVVAERAKDGERVVAAYENAGEQQAAARALQADGFAVKLTMAKAYSRSMDGSAGKFIGDVLAAIDKMDLREANINGTPTSMKAQLLDDLNQLFIKALPDLSYRKHFTHRKGTAGFSADVMRGFASSAFHAAGHIARLNHGDKMTFALDDAYQQIKLAPEGDFTKAGQVLNEMALRHEAALNPNVSPLSALATQVGFVMYLGLSPAAGLINMMQVPMVALPYIGARYGFAKATAAMGRAYTDIMGAKPNAKNGFNAAQSPKLSADERRAISTLQDEGVIDLTQAHDLAAATTRDVGNQARNKASFAIARAMRIVGWTFHVPEVMNRQVTALMAYRLEMAKSGNEGKAMDAAREAIKRSQFDYASSNRARYMQGDIARVVTQFRQFSQNMTYFLGRAAYQALKGEDPEVRRIARQQLVATFLVTGAMAGSLGLPGLGFFAGLVEALVNAMGDDDDEPWDWKTAYRNMLADNFGKEWGEVMARGVPRALMPAWDISNRVSLSDLWWRDNSREGDSPREAFANDMSNILGPTAGTLLGWYTASDHMARGDYAKAVESVVPKFIRDPLKAWRESQDGVTSYNGEQLLELTGAEVAGRFMGFAPSRASEMYEGRGAVMSAKTALEDRRERLIAKMAKARIDGDTEAVAELQQRIRDWNTENPKMAITGATIVRSVLNRRRNTANTEKGITLPDSKDFLRDRARFAEVD